MCLNVDNVPGDLDGAKRIMGRKRIYYKVYSTYGGELCPSYRGRTGPVKGGWVKSNRPRKKLTPTESADMAAYRGIHVFALQSEARCHAWCAGEKVVRVTAYPRDLVATGDFGSRASAVFMKVWLSKAEKDKALKGATP